MKLVVARSTAARSPKIVTTPPRGTMADRDMQAFVLAALNSPQVQSPARPSLVSIARIPRSSSSSLITDNTKDLIVLSTDISVSKVVVPDHAFMGSRDPFKGPVVAVEETAFQRAISPWSSNTQAEKLLLASSSFDPSESYSFTVNFSRRRMEHLEGDVRGVRFLRNHSSELAKLGPVVFVLERTNQGRLHVHGLIETKASFVVLREALVRLGQKSENPKFRGRLQVRIDGARYPLFYALYMLKEFDRAGPDRDQSLYLSHEAIRSAKEELEEVRAEFRAKTGAAPGFRGRYARKSHVSALAVPGRVSLLS